MATLSVEGDQSLVEQKEITRTTAGPVARTDDYKMVNEKCLTAQYYPVNWPGAWFTP